MSSASTLFIDFSKPLKGENKLNASKFQFMLGDPEIDLTSVISPGKEMHRFPIFFPLLSVMGKREDFLLQLPSVYFQKIFDHVNIINSSKLSPSAISSKALIKTMTNQLFDSSIFENYQHLSFFSIFDKTTSTLPSLNNQFMTKEKKEKENDDHEDDNEGEHENILQNLEIEEVEDIEDIQNHFINSLTFGEWIRCFETYVQCMIFSASETFPDLQEPHFFSSFVYANNVNHPDQTLVSSQENKKNTFGMTITITKEEENKQQWIQDYLTSFSSIDSYLVGHPIIKLRGIHYWKQFCWFEFRLVDFIFPFPFVKSVSVSSSNQLPIYKRKTNEIHHSLEEKTKEKDKNKDKSINMIKEKINNEIQLRNESFVIFEMILDSLYETQTYIQKSLKAYSDAKKLQNKFILDYDFPSYDEIIQKVLLSYSY